MKFLKYYFEKNKVVFDMPEQDALLSRELSCTDYLCYNCVYHMTICRVNRAPRSYMKWI